MRRDRGGGRYLRSVAAAALLLPPASEQVAAWVGWGARADEGLGGGGRPREPRACPCARAGISRAPSAAHGSSHEGKDLVRSWTEGGGGGRRDESLWTGRGQALNFSLRRLLGLRLREFSRRRERGLVSAREVSARGWRKGPSLFPSKSQSSAPTCPGRSAPQLEAGVHHSVL